MPRRAKLPKKAREPKLSHTRRPSGLEVEQWQAQLRRQFGRVQAFKLENLGEEPVFSEFQVTNPQSGGSYRVAIRDAQPAAPSGNDNGNGNGQPGTANPWIETDAQTGRSYLKLPMPEPQVVQQLSDALSRLISSLGR